MTCPTTLKARVGTISTRVELLERVLDELASCEQATERDDVYYHLNMIYMDLTLWHDLPTDKHLLAAYHAKGVAQSYICLLILGALDGYEQLKSVIRNSIELAYSHLTGYRDHLAAFLPNIDLSTH